MLGVRQRTCHLHIDLTTFACHLSTDVEQRLRRIVVELATVVNQLIQFAAQCRVILDGGCQSRKVGIGGFVVGIAVGRRLAVVRQ